jgi:outer membrane protein
MKRLFTVSCAALSVMLFSLSSVYAQQLKIGIFDMQQVLRESKIIQGYRMKLEQEIGTKRNQLAQKREWIRAIEEKLKNDDKSLAIDDRIKLSDKLSQESRDLRRLNEDVETEIQKMDRGLSDSVFKELGQVVTDLAAKEGYDIVFERRQAGITYSKQAFDITKIIIEAYDSKK